MFQRMGQIWVLKYEGKMVLMEDARGMIVSCPTAG